MQAFATGIEGFTVRFADEGDTATLFGFIKGHAAFEKMEEMVVATEALLREWIFERGMAEVLIAQWEGEAVGYALFFHNFSTFLGRAGVYLEDLFILPAMRGKGFGKAMLRILAQITVERGCGRLEWTCLDWNAPAIRFYRSVGAQVLDEWQVHRLSGQRLRDLADQGRP